MTLGELLLKIAELLLQGKLTLKSQITRGDDTFGIVEVIDIEVTQNLLDKSGESYNLQIG